MIDGHGDDGYSYSGIRLNFSSNVYNRFSHEGLYACLKERLCLAEHYPEPDARTLGRVLARQAGVRPQEVMVTNGAVEAIYLTALAFRRSRTAILAPTFPEYADACRLHAHQVTCLHSLDDLSPQTEMLWLCNPNNPTGRVFPKELLLTLVDRHRETLFVMDASYGPFAKLPLMTPAEAVARPNVVMLHSMTKEFAVPGLRLGWLTACRALTERIGRGRMPWSVNALAQEAGHYLLAHRDDYVLPLEALLAERRRVGEALRETGVCEAMPSDTHILLCRLHSGRAADLKDFLARERGILIRDASNFEGLDGSYFRIAVQNPSEDDELIAGIQAWRAAL